LDTIGYHYIVEAAGCDPDILRNPDRMREVLIHAAKQGEMGVRNSFFYKFAPEGVSGVVIVSESHISAHTWPEKGYAALDVYICGDEAKPERAIEVFLREMGARDAHVTEIKRGIPDEDVFTHAMLTWDETFEKQGERPSRQP